MKKVFLLLIIPTIIFSQYRSSNFRGSGGGSGSLDLSTLLPIIADSTDWTAGSTVHAIKPKGAKTVEADSVKAGSLEVTGNARFNGNVTMVTTAGEQVQLGTGSNAAPELSSAGDTNTGIRFPGGDKMQLVQNGLNSHTFRPYKYTQLFSDGDTLGIYQDGAYARFASSSLYLLFTATTGVKINGTLVPYTDDQKTFGQEGNAWRYGYFSDYLYVGSKGNDATIVWGKQKTLTQLGDSCGVLDNYNGSSRIRMMAADSSEGLYYVAGPVAIWDSLNVRNEKSVIADDGTIVLATGVAGWGSVMAGDNEQWADFAFSANGTVTLKANSAKVSKTASAGDDSLMVYDAGSGIAIKNRLGATKKIALTVKYFSP